MGKGAVSGKYVGAGCLKSSGFSSFPYQAYRSPAGPAVESQCQFDDTSLLCCTFKTVLSAYHSQFAADSKSVGIRSRTFPFPSHIVFIISGGMHGSNQYGSDSPAVTALRKASATFPWWAETEQSNATVFQRGWSCQKLTRRKRPECNPEGKHHWLIHSSDCNAFSWTFGGSENMTALWSLFS